MYDLCYVWFVVLRVLRLLGQTAAEQFRNAGSEARPNVGVALKKFSHFGAFLLLSAGGWFCLRFPHVCRRGWIREDFQSVRNNMCVIRATHQVRRTHTSATHITHHSVRSPPRVREGEGNWLIHSLTFPSHLHHFLSLPSILPSLSPSGKYVGMQISK